MTTAAGRTTVLLAALAVVAVASWPVVVTEILPLLDYPNHLARMHILLDYDRSAALRTYYEIRWAALPNLAMEMVVLPLAAVLPLATAGKTFVILALALQVAGVIAIHRVLHGRWSPWPLAVAVVLYNDTYLFGFVNYLFGFGLALLGFAGWIALAARPAWLRLAYGTVLAVVVYFCHLSAFGIYAILLCGYEAGRAVERWRAHRRPLVDPRWLVTIASLLVPVVIALAFSPTGQGSQSTGFGWLTDKWHYVQKIDLLFDVFRNYEITADRATCALFAAVVGLGIATRRLVFAPCGLVTWLAVTAAFVLAPKRFLTGDFLDDRLAIASVFVLIATTDWRGVGVRWQRAIVGVLLAVFVGRIALVEAQWRVWDRQMTAYVRALQTLPEGSRLIAAMGYCCDSWARRRPPLVHVPNYVITLRDGFYPQVFAIPGQQPIALRPPYDALAERVKDDLTIRTRGSRHGVTPIAANPYERERLAGFDYMLVVNGDTFDVPPPPFLRPVITGDRFGLYKIE